MAEGTSESGLSDQDWMLEQVAGDAPALIVGNERSRGGDDIADQSTETVDVARDMLDAPRARRDRGCGGERPHELDDPAGENPSEVCGPDVNSGAKRAAVWLGSGVLAVAALIVAAFVVFGGGPDRVAPPQHHATIPAVAAAPTTANPPVPQQDHAVPFTARTDSCSPEGGSTEQPAARSPQALSDTGTDSAWVCGRGPQESLLDGQMLHVHFGCDPSRPTSACSYMLNSVSVTPGWVAKTPGGKDEWLQHRVVTRLQFNFFNGNQLVADPLFVDTRSIHGPVPAALPAKILASRVDVIILHTERPPAAPLPTTTAPAPDPTPASWRRRAGCRIRCWGPPPPSRPLRHRPTPRGRHHSDPVDATFAMSQLQFFGHSPT